MTLAWGGCGESPPAGRPNVLLISLDSTRADFLGAYGHKPRFAPEVSTTPYLDRLAAQGALFENAYSTTSWTLPSHAAILTGQPDLVHAVELEIYQLDGSHPTLAEILRRSGYRTAGFYSGPLLEAEFGFGRGFERYVACYGEGLRTASARARETATRLAEKEEGGFSLEQLEAWEINVAAQRALENAAQTDLSSSEVTDAVLAELEAAAEDERPFFLFAHYFDPHFDYVPPAPFDRRFDPDYEGTLDGRGFYSNPAISTADEARPSGRRRVASDRDLDHLRALYGGDLAWTDAQVGRVLERLDELGLAKDTIVVVVGDHGDEFFEHDGIGHRRTLFEEVLHVPLILRYPDRVTAGSRVSGVVSTTDIAPTLMEWLDLDPRTQLRSVSLVPFLASGSAAERGGVMSRLVRTTPMRVQLPGDLEEPTPVDMVFVTESFRTGKLEIRRERRWFKPPANIDPERLRALLDESRRLREQETLSWIDLDAAPEEREADFQYEFGAGAPRAALQAFHDLYLELLSARRSVGAGAGDEALRSALRGLGYVAELEVGGNVEPEEFVLPPPGAAILKGGG